MRFYNTYSNYVPAATTKTLHTGPGNLHVIHASASVGAWVTIYDNTAGSGNILLSFYLTALGYPYFVAYPPQTPLKFSTGLTVVTAAGTVVHLITSAA